MKLAYREKPEDIHAKNLIVLKDRIKENKIGGSYIFYGEEEYTKNHYYSLLCSLSGDKKLNTHTFFSQEFNLADFMSAVSINAVQSIDMFSDMDEEQEQSKVRVIKLINPDFSELTKKDMDFFCDTISDLPDECVVVFWFYEGQNDFLKNSSYKTLCEKSLVVNFKKEPIGSAALVTWILRHFSKVKINADRNVAVHLCNIVGNSMTALKNEIDKCIDFLAFEKKDTITIQDVDFVCIKSTQAQTFDVSNGALMGNFVKAASALKVLRDRKEDPVLVLGTISKAVNDLCTVERLFKEGKTAQEISKKTRLFDFAVKNYITVINFRGRDFSGKDSLCKIAGALCYEYDKKIKTSRTDSYQLLLELVFKISFAGKTNN